MIIYGSFLDNNHPSYPSPIYSIGISKKISVKWPIVNLHTKLLRNLKLVEIYFKY